MVGDVARSARARSTWSPPPAWRTPTGCRCCCCPATRSPAAAPTRCCSRSSTSATRRRRVNDAFRAVSRYFDRITRPEQLLDDAAAGGPRCSPTRPTAGRSSLAPAAGRAGRGVRLPGGDVRRRACTACRGSDPTSRRSPTAAVILRTARRPLLVAGGGVRYSGAGDGGARVRRARTASRSSRPSPAAPCVPHDAPAERRRRSASSARPRPTPWPPRPTSCSRSAPGCRTSPRRRGRCSRPDVRIIGVNAARFDAVKHGAHAVVGDARETRARARTPRWAAGRPTRRGRARAASEKAGLGRAHRPLRDGRGPRRVADLRPGRRAWSTTPAARTTTCSPRPAACPASCTAAGAPVTPRHPGRAPPARRWTSSTASPAWATRSPAPWGAAMARSRTHPDGVVTALLGDGSYLMLNSELYSAAFAGHPFVAVVCDNGGYAVIHRLQTGQGAPGFNNLLVDAVGPGAPARRPARRLRRARPLRSGARSRTCPRDVRRSTTSRRRTAGPATAAVRPAVPRSSCAGPTPPRGPRRARGGRSACRVAVRARGVRRAQGDPGAVAAMRSRRPAATPRPFSRRDRPGHGDPSRSPARCS